MRKILSEQVQMGEIDITTLEIELDSRDEIPQLLRGLQYIYKEEHLRNKIFKLLWEIVPKGVDIKNGRKGMDLWRIFVLGTLRLNCNWDYDKLQEIANNHHTLRQMLGHGMLDFETRYPRQTLNDNLSWFTPAVLDKINQIVVNAGMGLLEKETVSKKSSARCDSFVLETDVHFPTDLNLLWDAVRKALQLSHKMAQQFSIAGWRQTPHNIRTLKSLFRYAQKHRDKDKDSAACIQATQHYIDEATNRLFQAEIVAGTIQNDPLYGGVGDEIQRFVDHGKRQIDQISRRCFNDETIPHEEKVFSLFKEHTEWISKGKAGVLQELGLRVCIMESSTGFILHHRVMQQETDDSVAVSMVKETQQRYSYVRVCSFDKGFHSPKNQEALSEILDLCVLPRKGKLSPERKRVEGTTAFGEKRRKHSAVESAINALENHGLDRCCDQGINGFRRYVALAVVARNLQLIGVYLQKQELEKLEERKRKVA